MSFSSWLFPWSEYMTSCRKAYRTRWPDYNQGYRNLLLWRWWWSRLYVTFSWIKLFFLFGCGTSIRLREAFCPSLSRTCGSSRILGFGFRLSAWNCSVRLSCFASINVLFKRKLNKVCWSHRNPLELMDLTGSYDRLKVYNFFDCWRSLSPRHWYRTFSLFLASPLYTFRVPFVDIWLFFFWKQKPRPYHWLYPGRYLLDFVVWEYQWVWVTCCSWISVGICHILLWTNVHSVLVQLWPFQVT